MLVLGGHRWRDVRRGDLRCRRRSRLLRAASPPPSPPRLLLLLLGQLLVLGRLPCLEVAHCLVVERATEGEDRNDDRSCDAPGIVLVLQAAHESIVVKEPWVRAELGMSDAVFPKHTSGGACIEAFEETTAQRKLKESRFLGELLVVVSGRGAQGRGR